MTEEISNARTTDLFEFIGVDIMEDEYIVSATLRIAMFAESIIGAESFGNDEIRNS